MIAKYFMGLLVILLAVPTFIYGSEGDCNLYIQNITKMSYNHILFLDYGANNNPTFYTHDLKRYYITPITVGSVGINESLLSSMNFKINNTNYDVLISNKNVKIDDGKKAILFIPLTNSSTNEIHNKNNTDENNKNTINKNKVEVIYWKVDPLDYNTSEVIAKYSYPNNKGKIIAIYSNGSPACIMIGNKIYCGFEPNKEVLYNLLYIFMIHEVPNSLLFGILLLLILISIGCSSQSFKDSIREFFIKLSAFMVIGRISTTDEEKVLLNNTRREIYNYIIDNPGVHLREIAKKLNKGVSTITWHLRILEKADLIRNKKIGNKLIYYPKGMDISDLPLLYLNNETSQEIFRYILNNPAHLRKIAEDLDMPVETVRYNLKKMEEMNLVNRKEKGNKIIYSVNQEYVRNLNLS
jgi:predicted transcriptional regulator